MSTRSIMALADNDGFKDGVYVHSDGYPSGRGPLLFKMLAARGDDLSKLWADIDSAKHHGWSCLNTAQKAPHPSVLGRRGKWVAGVGQKYTAAQCQDDSRFNWHGEPLDTDAEWVYAFDLDHNIVSIFKTVPTGRNFDSKPMLMAVVRMDQPEPDWTPIECGANYERCQHMAWAHFPEAKDSNLGATAWLGLRPLTPQDATGCIYNGETWQFTGSGSLERTPNGYGKKWFNYAQIRTAAGDLLRDMPIWVWSNTGTDQVKVNPAVTLIYPKTAATA